MPQIKFTIKTNKLRTPIVETWIKHQEQQNKLQFTYTNKSTIITDKFEFTLTGTAEDIIRETAELLKKLPQAPGIRETIQTQLQRSKPIEKHLAKNTYKLEVNPLITGIKPVETLEDFEQAWDMKNRRIDETKTQNGTVSTVFLALDHNLAGNLGEYQPGKYGGHNTHTPILFETLVFKGSMDGYMVRYTNRKAAIAGHKKIVELVKKHKLGQPLPSGNEDPFRDL